MKFSEGEDNLTVSCCLTMCTMRQEIMVFRLNLCQTRSSSMLPTRPKGFLARGRSEASEPVANARRFRGGEERAGEGGEEAHLHTRSLWSHQSDEMETRSV